MIRPDDNVALAKVVRQGVSVCLSECAVQLINQCPS